MFYLLLFYLFHFIFIFKFYCYLFSSYCYHLSLFFLSFFLSFFLCCCYFIFCEVLIMRKGLNKIKDEYQNLLLLFIDSLTKEFFN